MKLGQTSVVYFLSRVAATFAGFLATIYLARELGASVLGDYYLAVGIVSWVTIPASFGMKGAMSKRISEGEDIGEYIAAGALLFGLLLGITVAAVILFRPYMNGYLGRPITWYVVLLVVVGTVSNFIVAVLRGRHKIHVVGLLVPIRTITRGMLQVGVVVLGAGIVGLLVGHAVATIVSILVGLTALSLRFSRPEKRHFEALLSFARYSWIGQIQSRTFNQMDIIVLGFFVSSGLIGVYSISWNVASFLGLFAHSLSATLFPELSKLSAQEQTTDVRELLEVSLSYAGLIHIPGIVGAALLGNRILRIYGEEFISGEPVLLLLVFAYLIHSYNRQILTALDSIDRPDLTFRANAVLIVSNIVLNVALVWIFGWIGAAVATTLSMALSFATGYWYLTGLVEFNPPLGMILKQSVAGLVMGGVVFLGLRAENSYGILANNVATVLLLVGLGAGVYFLLMFAISTRFRIIVRDNLPNDILV